MARNTLGRTARLKHRKQIDALFRTGKSLMAFPYRIYYREIRVEEVESAQVLFGVGVSKRYFKKAIDRNRIKRLTREAYRHRQEALKLLVENKRSALDLFFIFTGKELPDLQLCELAVAAGLEKLSRTIGPAR